MRSFVESLLSEKLSAAKSRAGFVRTNDFLDEWMQGQREATKRALRQQAIDLKLPLTRLDLHILVRLLDRNGSGKITKGAVLDLIENPTKFAGQEPMGVRREARNTEDLMREAFDDGLKRLSFHLDRTRTSLEGAFRANDPRHNGFVDVDAFKRVLRDVKAPLTALEVNAMFDYLVERIGKKAADGSRKREISF